jgi:exonuclease SbcD
VRIIHTADLHLGITTYGSEDASTGSNRRVDDFFSAFDQCIQYAIDRKADALLLCGDVFKDVSPSPTLLKMFAGRLLRLTLREIKVLMLLGNHDSPKTVGRAAPLEVFDELKLPGVHVFVKPGMVDLVSHDGVKFRVFALPYRHPMHMAYRAVKNGAAMTELSMNHLLDAFRAEVSREIQALTARGKEDAEIAFLAAHLFVEGARRGAESLYIVGAEFTVPQSVLESNAVDFVALGHIHSFQKLPGRVPTVYAGSLERVDFSEIDEQKGFVDIVYEGKSLSWKFIPVKTRRMVKIELDCPQAGSVTEVVTEGIKNAQVEDAIVKLVLKTGADTNLDFDLIHKRLTSAFWYQITVERIFDKPILETSIASGLNPHETLARYLKSMKLSAEDRAFVARLGDEIIDEALAGAG